MLAVASGEGESAARLIDARFLEGMSDEERAAAEAVVDLDADELTCPACTATFPRGIGRCPECGLNLGF